MPMEQLLTLLLGTAAAAFIKGGTGMGAGLFLLPALTIAFDPFTALSLSCPLLLFMDAFTACYHWKKWIKGQTMMFLLVAASIGTVIGVMVLPLFSVVMLKIAVGGVGVTYAVSNLFPALSGLSRLEGLLPAAWKKGNRLVYGLAFIGGAFNAINAGGVFHAFACMRLNLLPRNFVGTMVLIVLTTSVWKVSGYWLIDLLPWSNLLLSIKLIPLVAVFCWVGSKTTGLFNPQTFRKSIYILILAMCAKTLLSAL